MRTWFIIGGIVQIVLGLGSFWVPVIMHIEENHADQPVIEAPLPIAVPVLTEVELTVRS